MIYELENRSIQTEGQYFIADTAVVIGAVTLKNHASVWWGAVLRGDYDSIVVGEESNVQDNCVVHMDEDFPVSIGDRVTVGHKAVLHGCTIGNNSLIGINSIVMNGAIIGNNCLVGSNTLITEGKEIPDGSLVLGSPGKVIRQITDAEIEDITGFSERYVINARRYREGLRAQTMSEVI
ncbi:MAG: gamma carbonic anhydrase family protein [Chloroflexi bacterium]|nr:gamma carbonic anhydrase family protein [Chloroflexota bacterium]|tara:strand:+ start:174 stop:710 length:537 start_codon:yes stop_codon:yes gene_type:complete